MAIENIVTPDLGGATEVTVIEIAVKPGEQIEKEATVVTLESDKASMDIPTSFAGRVKEVKVKVGDKVTMGQVLATLEVSGDVAKPAAEETKTPEKSEKAETAVPRAPQPIAVEKPVTPPVQAVALSLGEVHAGPAVRRFARELGVDLTKVSGTGPKNRILKEDVQGFVKGVMQSGGGAAAISPLFAPMPVVDFAKFGPVETVPLSRIKKISGKFLQRNSAMIPHVTQFEQADITALEAFRQEKKAECDKLSIKLTPLVFIMKAVVKALQQFPQFNSSLNEAGDALVIKQYYHLGVAVDTPDGLVVPVIRDVEQKGLLDLAKELAVVSAKARKKELAPGDMQGGTFSISSLGGIGGTAFTPIINAPEVAILGVSKSSYQPVWQNKSFEPRLLLPLSLSYDHRVIDGADGARFIVYLAQMLSDIRNILL